MLPYQPNSMIVYGICWVRRVNTLRPRQNGCLFPDNIFKWIFLNENVWISLRNSLKFVPRVPINNIRSLVQIMAWCRPGDKPLSDPMLVFVLTHTCVTRPQWVKHDSVIEFISSYKKRTCNHSGDVYISVSIIEAKVAWIEVLIFQIKLKACNYLKSFQITYSLKIYNANAGMYTVIISMEIISS